MAEPTGFKIRNATVGDAEAFFDMFGSYDSYANTYQLPYPSLSSWRERIENGQKSGVYLLVAVNDKDVAIGVGGLNTYSDTRRKHVATFFLTVHEAYRGKGIGRLLLNKVVELGENWLQLKRIELNVYVTNHPAIKLYESAGFCHEGVSKAHVFTDGKYVDAHVMARVTA